jgi:hypothetical protein
MLQTNSQAASVSVGMFQAEFTMPHMGGDKRLLPGMLSRSVSADFFITASSRSPTMIRAFVLTSRIVSFSGNSRCCA